MEQAVAILAPGRMGCALAAEFVRRGVTVRTSLRDRSAESIRRARAAGMVDSSDAEIAGCGLVLSIVPPAEAVSVARRLETPLRQVGQRPVYVDLNAIAPRTAGIVERIVTPTGARFADGCIIGTPPAENYAGPFLYVTDPAAAALLARAGLNVRVIDGPPGAASALKMCFAGIMKGLTALGATLFMAAERVGVSAALREELAGSQPELAAWFDRQIPAMYPKIYRWVAEMEEISGFIEDDPAGRELFRSISHRFAALSDGSGRARDAVAVLEGMFPPAGTGGSGHE